MYVLVFYVPASHLEQVKDAIFSAGAGSMGNYERCCWEVVGRGQFLPSPGARPFLGQVGEIEKVEEWRVETVVEESRAVSVVEALLASHPYEEVSYHLIPVLTLEHAKTN